jgi:HEAT repeat protein
MPVNMQQVLAEIDKDEPNYSALAKLGPDALPHLRLVMESADSLRAAKAAWAASLVGGPASVDALKQAATHQDPQVRIAAAHGLRSAASAPGLRGAAAAAPIATLSALLEDSDPGVRKSALRTASYLKRPELRAKLTAIAAGDSEEHNRVAAAAAVKQLPKPR